VFNFPFEVEHIIPLVRGGTNADANLALSCRSCNIRKGAHVEDVDPVTGTAARLFDPRHDRWSDHFRVDIDRGIIEGLSAIGRATVKRLTMNGAAQVRHAASGSH
jgi:hypothetical protein